MRCQHIIHEQSYNYRCTRAAKTDMNVCWQHTAKKVAEQIKREGTA